MKGICLESDGVNGVSRVRVVDAAGVESYRSVESYSDEEIHPPIGALPQCPTEVVPPPDTGKQPDTES